MNQPPSNAQNGTIASAINLEFVRNVAESATGEGLTEVESFHRSLFLHQHGRDLEQFRQQRIMSESRLADLETRLLTARQRLVGEEPLLPVMEGGAPDTRPTAPWNLWDQTMFWIAAVGIACLLVFGVLNISFNLLESGIVTFTEHPVRAYLWAALLPVGALAVKIGWDFLESSRRQGIYLWTCLGIGMVAVLVWVAALRFHLAGCRARRPFTLLPATDQCGYSTDTSLPAPPTPVSGGEPELQVERR